MNDKSIIVEENNCNDENKRIKGVSQRNSRKFKSTSGVSKPFNGDRLRYKDETKSPSGIFWIEKGGKERPGVVGIYFNGHIKNSIEINNCKM
jgi:hypothetical protein